MSSPTNWRAHILLFSKPKYARRFSLFLANQFDAGYEKWQSEQPPGTLNVEIELEAIRLKSKLKRGICNKSFVPDEDDEIAKLQRPNLDEDDNEKDDVNSNISEMNSSLPHLANSTSGSSYIINSTVNGSCKLPNIPRGKQVSPSAVPKTSMQIPNNASSNHQKPGNAFWQPGEASQSVPLHLLDSNDGYNEFTNAESELCSNFNRFLRFNNVENEENAAATPNTPTHDEVFRVSPPSEDGGVNKLFSPSNAASEGDCQNDNASSLEKMTEQMFLDDDYTVNDNIFERKMSESSTHHVNQDFLLEL